MNYAALKPIESLKTTEKAPQTRLLDLDTLDTLKNADTITKRLGFVVTCGVKNGQVEFCAQLKGGKKFTCSPIMPEAEEGSVRAPRKGQSGYLTIRLSENAKLLEVGGEYGFTINPEFVEFEPVDENAVSMDPF